MKWLKGNMSLLKKFVITMMTVVALSFVCIPSTSYAYEVEIKVGDEGPYCVETNSIRYKDGIYSVQVYMLGHTMVDTWKYRQKEGKWYCQHMGTGPIWITFKPNQAMTYVLDVILHNV